MKNEIEVIDGVRGEWRTVTKPEEVFHMQKVKAESNIAEIDGLPTFVTKYDLQNKGKLALFNGAYKKIKAFFPLPVAPAKRKVAKVYLTNNLTYYWWVATIAVKIESTPYSSRSHAIRGARRFCKAIGYECEIVK